MPEEFTEREREIAKEVGDLGCQVQSVLTFLEPLLFFVDKKRIEPVMRRKLREMKEKLNQIEL